MKLEASNKLSLASRNPRFYDGTNFIAYKKFSANFTSSQHILLANPH